MYSKEKTLMRKVDMYRLEPQFRLNDDNKLEMMDENMLRKLYPNKEMFSIGEVAAIIGMSYDFVAEQIRKEKIFAVPFGVRRMVPLKELCRILNEGVGHGFNKKTT